MTAPAFKLPHLASRVFGRPLAIGQDKLDAILHAIGPKLGVQVPAEAARSFEERQRRELTVTQDGVAVISVLGTLVHRTTGLDAFSGLTSYQTLAAELQSALEDRSVSAILLDIDSPGGEVSGVFDLADKIRAARSLKPVYAVANESAFSAAYAIASAASRVYVPRTGGVGSIGVVALHVDQSKADEQRGLSYTYVHAGARKVEGNSHQPLADDVRASIQGEIDRVYDLFVGTVARNRGLSTESVRATEAGVFFGNEALAKGLADRQGTREDALADLAALTADDQQEEAMLAQLTEENEGLKAQLATAQAKIAELQSVVETHKAAAAEAREAEISAYLESVAQAATDAQSPLKAAEVEELRELFALGKDDLARKLGDAHVKAAEKLAQVPLKRDRKAEADKDLEARKAHAETEKRLLEARGFSVELNEEGTKVLDYKRKG